MPDYFFLNIFLSYYWREMPGTTAAPIPWGSAAAIRLRCLCSDEYLNRAINISEHIHPDEKSTRIRETRQPRRAGAAPCSAPPAPALPALPQPSFPPEAPESLKYSWAQLQLLSKQAKTPWKSKKVLCFPERCRTQLPHALLSPLLGPLALGCSAHTQGENSLL